MNLALDKGKNVTTGGKGRGEAREVTGVVTNAPTTDGLGNIEHILEEGGVRKQGRCG